MDGRRALVYSRIRENRLDPSDNDITRRAAAGHAGDRRQARQRRDILRLPFSGDELLRPLATDLSANQLLQLGWTKFRTGDTIRCRLGGDPETIGGASVIRSSEENRNVISMFLDESAPQPPRPGTGTYGPGCVAGGRSLGSR